MAELVFALPVSVEQIAVVIKQLDLADQKRLLELVPTLRQAASQLSASHDAGASFKRGRNWGGHPPSPRPTGSFLGGRPVEQTAIEISG